MARYREALCKLCRREGEKLFLKGDRCNTEKCSVERRKYPPGQHGQRRSKMTDYGVQLREKQKVRNTYGLMEKQFRRYFEWADKGRGVTGEMLLQFLERRLDNVVYRMGFADNRRQARQYVNHGLVMLNGKRVDIASCLVKAGDVVEVRAASQKIQAIADSMEKATHRGLPGWLELDAKAFKGTFLHVPTREEIALPVQEQLIVELYSK